MTGMDLTVVLTSCAFTVNCGPWAETNARSGRVEIDTQSAPSGPVHCHVVHITWNTYTLHLWTYIDRILALIWNLRANPLSVDGLSSSPGVKTSTTSRCWNISCNYSLNR